MIDYTAKNLDFGMTADLAVTATPGTATCPVPAPGAAAVPGAPIDPDVVP
jgi:hypothetical protein